MNIDNQTETISSKETDNFAVKNETVNDFYPDLLSTETCAYIHGSIVFTLLFIAFIR